MKVTKRIISILLTLGILLTSIPVAAFEKPSGAEADLQNGYAPTQDAYAIYPIPRSAQYTEGNFTLGTEITVVSEEGIDAYTNQFLDEILTDYGRTKTVSETIPEGTNQILLGIKGSGGAVDAWAESNLTLSDAELFTKTDAYLICANGGRIVILGKDTNAVYYGLATLQMMFSSFNGTKFLNVQIEDYAGMKMRGFIEGFYGGWTHDGRKSLMQFARDVKMNTYIYASKTDSYHKNDELYPADQINQIKELVAVGDQTKVKYCWSIHLSYFFNSLPSNIESEEYQTQFNQKFDRLKAKFQQLYDAGVRKFAVLNDDFGSGSHTEVVRLLNKLDDEFLVPKGCDNLTYCMQGYNKGWSNAGELGAMRALNESIDLFWTGDGVNSPITQDTIDFVKQQTGHEAVFWLNYPVNEHAKSGVYLGEISHYVRDDVTGLAGAVSNPSCLTEANKVGLFQLGSLFWNNHNYLSQAVTIWEESFKYLQPEVYQSYLTIARNIANCPGSSRVPGGFPESEYIKDSLDAVTEKIKKGTSIAGDQDAQKLIRAFTEMLSAISTFRSNCTNEALKADLEIWLKSLTDVATAGKASLEALIAMEQNNINEAWSNIGTAGKAMETWDSYTYVEPSQGATVNAQAGSKRLVPFVNKALAAAKKQIVPILDPSAEIPPSYIGVIHGVERTDTAEFAKAYDKDPSTYASFESGTQKTGDYMGVDLGKATPVHSIDILQGKNDTDHDIFHNAVLECSDTGEDGSWTQILKYDNDDAPIHIEKTFEGDGLTTRYIRLRLTRTGTANKNDYWTHIREITINGNAEQEPEYSLYASEGITAEVSLNSLNYSLTQTKEQPIAPGGYIGIKLKELSKIQSLTFDSEEAKDLTLQYSDNSRTWTDMPASPNNITARYVRLYNDTDHEIDVKLTNFALSVYGNAVDLSVADFNPEYTNLKEGSWSNLFDGKYETYIWTNTAQKVNHYIIIDFGAETPLYDFTITQEKGNPKFYNAEFYLSTDKTNWGSPVTSVAETNGAVTGPHWKEEGNYIKISRDDLNGVPARYMKIRITKDHGYFLRINEIEINKTISASDETVGKIYSETLKGDLDKIIDGDISSVYTSEQPSDGTASLTYPITENNKLSSITLLQNASSITNASVTAKVFDGSKVADKSLGALDQGITKFENLENEGDILSITVTWPQGTVPSLYEIITNPVVEERTHTISFSGEGAPAEKLTAAEGKIVTLPENTAQNNGREFRGWNDGRNTYAAGTKYVMGTKDVTMTAVWGDEIKVTSITVSPKTAELNIGATLQLSKTVAPENASNSNVIWSSDNEAIASVDAQTGLVTAHAKGTAVITATSEENSRISDTCTIEVKADNPGVVLVDKITVVPDKVTIKTGESITLSKTVEPENASNPNVIWSSDNEAVASVEPQTGKVDGKAKGNAKITATAQDGSGVQGVCEITVEEDGQITPPEKYTIEISPKSTELYEKETITLKANILPETAGKKELVWESDNDKIAKVDQNGVVTAIAKGTVIIKASAKEDRKIFGECTITVKENPPVKVKSVTVAPSTLKLNVGASKKLSVSVSPAAAADKTVTWSSSKPSVATVDPKSGQVKAVSAGTAKIKAKAKDGSGKYGICTVTVSKPQESIRVNKTYNYKDLRYTVTSLSPRTVKVAKSKNKNLKKITIPDTVTLQGKKYKVTAIVDNAFKDHKKVTSASVGKNVEIIGDNAFSGCVKLTNVSLKSTKLRSIGSKAFQNCKKLKSITIKSLSLKKIGKYAFKGIDKKAAIKVPSKKYKSYLKLFKNKGQAKTVKIKK